MSNELKIILIISGIILFFLILVLSSRSRIRRIYKKYMRVGNKANLTGGQFAQVSVNKLDLNIQLGVTDGELVDAYSSKRKMLIMSRDVCNTASLSALTIVAHELGHALQHKTQNPLFCLSLIWSKINRFLSKFIIPTLLAGIIVLFFNLSTAITILSVALGLFIFNLIDKIITIPVEYDASKRALWYLKEYKFLSNSEIRQAKKLLNVAAQTYIASLFDGLIIFGNKLNKLFNK